MHESWRFQIRGQLYSKANSRKFASVHGRMISIKNVKALAFERIGTMELRRQWGRKKPIEKPVVVQVHVWYPSERQDLDCSLLFDVMQKAGIIKNDRQIREQHLYHHIDKVNPRVEVTMYLRPKELQ